MDVEISSRSSLIKATLAVALGTYLATLAFVFGYLLWQTITVHLTDSAVQMAILATLAFIATGWGGYVASWFNYYRYGRLLGLCVGGSLYLVSALLLATAPDNFALVLPFADSRSTLVGVQGAIPPLIAGTLGGWLAERKHRLRR